MADIGGYLGLFLGLSAFGLVELLEQALTERKREESERKKKETDDLEDCPLNPDQEKKNRN